MEHSHDVMHQFNLYFGSALILLFVGVSSWALAKIFKKPYTIMLVVIGLIIGIANLPIFNAVTTFFTQSENFTIIVMSLFLPALIGEATIKLPFSHLNENRKPILLLAILGTLITFTAVAAGSYYILHLPIVVSFTFAALMSATDPISVLSIFKSLGVDRKLSITIEGESLLNDGVAVVLYKISSVFLLSYIDMGLHGVTEGLWMFIKVVSGGILIGAILGFAASLFIKFIDDFPLETMVSFILFYGCYIIGEITGVSGVIAVFVAALIFGNYGRKIGMTPVTKLNINNFWEIIAFVANTVIFLMVGMEIRQIDFSGKWLEIVLAIVIVLVARCLSVYGSTLFTRDIPLKHKHIINWGGLRGSLSIALALSLPHTFSGRDDILVLAFSVVLFSLLFQGLTIDKLIAWLGVTKKDNTEEEYEELISRIHRSKAAIEAIHEITSKTFSAKPIYQQELDKHKEIIDNSYSKLEDLFEDHPVLKANQLQFIQEKALYAQHDMINKLYKEGFISSKEAEEQKSIVIKDIIQLIEKE